MRPNIPPKFIQLKGEPELAAARNIGVSTVLYSGATSKYVFVGDSTYRPYLLTFENLPAEYLVRFNYHCSGWNDSGTFRLLKSTNGGPSQESSIVTQYVTGRSVIFSGTALVPAGTSVITPSYSATSNDGITESWSIDIIDKIRNDAFTVEASTNEFAPVVNLGESFTWVDGSVEN